MTKYKATPKLKGYYYSPEEAHEARKNGKLLSMRVETSLMCNLKCKYCCNKSGTPLQDEISYEKIIDIINQAKDLGAKSIVVIGGGEPTIYPKFRELIYFVANQGMIPVIFTNTTTMTKELAKYLYDTNTTVITKLDSLTEGIQDNLVGVKGTYRLIQEGLSNLIEVGFADVVDDSQLRLGASFVVNKINMHEVPQIWNYCRENRLFPNIEMMIPNGNAKDLDDVYLSKEDWKKLKLSLVDIDRNKYGYDWNPYMPHGGGCMQVYYNMYVTVKGFARPCSSIHADLAGVDLNVNKMSLEEIINSKFFQISRNLDKHLTGKCGSCEHIDKCTGCRGMAFAVAINSGKDAYEAICCEDPTCFK